VRMLKLIMVEPRDMMMWWFSMCQEVVVLNWTQRDNGNLREALPFKKFLRCNEDIVNQYVI
jgi:hypothetical protein